MSDTGKCVKRLNVKYYLIIITNLFILCILHNIRVIFYMNLMLLDEQVLSLSKIPSYLQNLHYNLMCGVISKIMNAQKEICFEEVTSN